ncbi:MAG: hypothetical protein JXK95_14620, partial [Bacteroidales bacterium]|nr:hypothetical protein [Bacteroidales bacterium]
MKTLKSIKAKNTNTKSISQTDNKAQLCFFLVLIFISFFLFNADLKAQPDKAGINFKISDYGNATAKTDPAVAYNSKDDEYFVVWFDETNKEVRGRIISGSDPASSTSNSFRIDGGYAIDPARPALAYNSDDNQYFVIWETSGGVSAQYIAGRAYDADGNALDANTLSYYPGWNAKVEYCSDNKQYIVVYVNFSNVLGFWVDANCRSGSSFYFLIGNSKINIKNIDLAKGSDQYFMVVWGAKWDYNNEEYTGIRGNFIHATYKQSSKSFQISWYDGQWYGAKDPAVAFDPDTKKYLVIWRDTRHHQSASDNHSIYGQYVNQATTEQYHQNNFQVVPKGSTFDLKNPDIVFDKAHDSFLASWDQGDIYGQMIQNTILVGSNVPISTAANAQNSPQLVYNSTREEILCVWEDHRFSPSEIYGQRLGITQTITVDKPAAGDVWNAGSTRYIRWHCKNFTDSVRILISYEGYDQKYWLAVDFMKNTANDGTYEWIVPDNPSKNCVIMIVDAADGSPKGYSGVFEITGSTGNTSTGSKVTVLLNDNFTLTFDEVTAAGNTTLETSQTGPEPPESLVVHPSNNPLYYDIKTTAAFTGAVNLTFSYEDAGMTPEMEEDLILMHFGEASSEWTDITTSVDIDQNLI